MEKDLNGNPEMTIRDLSNSMNERFNMAFTEFEKIHKENNALAGHVYALQLGYKEIQEEMKVQEEQLSEIQETLNTLSNAFDKDAVTLVKHEQRISLLEGKNPALSTTN